LKGDNDVAKKPVSGPGSDQWYKDVEAANGSKPKTGFQQAKFVRGELNQQEKDHVKSQNYIWDDIPEHIESLVDSGYKITCSQDNYNGAYAVWITAQDKDNPNYGYILSARGPTLLAAFSVGFYKHFTKFDGVWPKDDKPIERDPWG